MFQDIEDFVYDLYYAQHCDDIWFESDNIQVRQSEYQNEGCEEEYELSDDSSDSNAEAHYRNDYPDTEPSYSDDSNENDSDENELYDITRTNHERRRRRRQELDYYFNDESSDNSNLDLGEETYDHMMKLAIEEESSDEQTSD